MPVTRSNADFNATVEWTEQILELPNVSSFIKDMGLFKNLYTDQNSVLFDKNTVEHSLLSTVNRRGGTPTRNTDRKVETFSLPLAYFHHLDTVTKADYENKRRAGTADQEETLANVTTEKLEDMRRAVDETHEYMMLQAIKGNCVTPDGVTLADMFSLFGQTQITVDFLLGTSTTNVKAKCGELLRKVQQNLKSGGRMSGDLPLLVDSSFFDKLVNHADVKEAYLNYASNAVYQDLDKDFKTWGIVRTFRFQGVLFMEYVHDFVLPSGNTEAAIAANTGHVVPRFSGNQSIFRAVYGPSTRMDISGGSEMFAFEYRDPRQRFHDMEVETNCLFYAEKPLSLVKAVTSN